MEIGEKIKQLRTEKKLSQKELALKIGVTQTNIAYFESRGNAITLENAFKIATALEVSIESLLFDDIDYAVVPNSKEVDSLLIAKDKEIEDLRKEIEVLTLKKDSFRGIAEYYSSFVESVKEIGLEQTEDKFGNTLGDYFREMLSKMKTLPPTKMKTSPPKKVDREKVDRDDQSYEFIAP